MRLRRRRAPPGSASLPFLDPYDIEVLGEQLAHYVAESRSYGSNTSLVVFTRPRPVQTLDAYYRKLWLTLDQLARLDKSPWPADIPEQVDHPMWEFSFAGEPIFVVCTTPAHVMRQSRRSSAFMLTFQPRWVFGNLGTEKAANAAFAEVRKRLIPYDSTSPSPLLGRYGAADGREYLQYFLHDDNHPGGAVPSPGWHRARPPISKTRSKRHDQDHRLARKPNLPSILRSSACCRSRVRSSCNTTPRARCIAFTPILSMKS